MLFCTTALFSWYYLPVFIYCKSMMKLHVGNRKLLLGLEWWSIDNASYTILMETSLHTLFKNRIHNTCALWHSKTHIVREDYWDCHQLLWTKAIGTDSQFYVYQWTSVFTLDQVNDNVHYFCHSVVLTCK